MFLRVVILISISTISKQILFPWSVNRNSIWSSDKSIRILIGIWKNQSEHEQSMSRTITAHPIHEVNKLQLTGTVC